MTKHKKKYNQARTIWLMFLGLVGLIFLIGVLLRGADIALLNPKGPIAEKQLDLMIQVVAIMLVIAVPTLTILYSFAWKYRETNNKATYDANTHHGKLFVFSLWMLPFVFMVVLALIMWPATHKLEPQKPIYTDTKPLTIQVIAMRWKWLFIYPEHNIATVNYVQIPVDVPVEFELSADEAPMSSFWIPHLGGQLYAMTGHVNRLNLMAETPGDYTGSSAEINGAGFAGMKFITRASSKQDFDLWVKGAQRSVSVLDSAEYEKLLVPSQNNLAAFYITNGTDLYDKMLMKYAGSHDHQPAKYEGGGH